MNNIKNSQIKIEIENDNGEFIDISKLCSDIGIKFSIFDLSSTLMFQYSDNYNYDVIAGDVMRVTLIITSNNITKSKTRVYKVFSLRNIVTNNADKEKLKYVVDCIDIHTFYFYRSISSKYLTGNLTSMLNQYIKSVWLDNELNLVRFPITLDIENSDDSIEELLTNKRKVVDELSDMTSYLKNYIAYSSLKGLNFKNINTLIQNSKIEIPSLYISEKDKLNNQNYTYSIEYNFDMLNSYNYGLYGFNVYTWDTIKNQMSHYRNNVLTTQQFDYLPTFKYWYQQNSIFNNGTTIILNMLDFYDIGDIVQYNALKSDSKYNGKYMIIESDYVYIEQKLGFTYKLWKI
jgi:hypothetical protein